tara:strand:+ start:57 stop:491 length:435 start_codon:yes stop_codon:yes gene_type:complete
MKIRTSYKIGIAIFVIGIAILLSVGIKNPPEKLNATELSAVEKVMVNNGSIHILTDKEIELWNSIRFDLTTENYPGETPGFVVKLLGKKANFSAMYNESSGIVFFSFVPEISYGIFNSPAPGGWTKPIYETQANDKLLELLKLK